MSQENYRLYSVTNMYLSSLQNGLQTSHVVAEMNKWDHDPRRWSTFKTWANEDKTIIILNGGYSSNLHRIFDVIRDNSVLYPDLPYGRFFEEEDALGSALTAVAIVLPERIWSRFSEKQLPYDIEMQPGGYETSVLYNQLSKLPLAR